MMEKSDFHLFHIFQLLHCRGPATAPADYLLSCGLHWGIWTCQSSPSSGSFTHVLLALRSEANSTGLLSLIHSLLSTLLFLVLRSPYPLMILLADCFACLSSHFLYQHVAFKKTGVLSVKFTVEFLTGHFLACGMHLRIVCWVNKWKQIHRPYSTEDLASKSRLHSHPPHPVSL